MKTLLQILPQAAGVHGGVVDYATNLARSLVASYEIETVFATSGRNDQKSNEFAVRSFEASAKIDSLGSDYDFVLLHYANYGYDRRGVPSWLPSFARNLQGESERLLTIFHELFAQAAPWRSAFWLQPWQRRVAAEIASVSDHCIVSNALAAAQLRALNPEAAISLQPVPSNFGEPQFSTEELDDRDGALWVICGGAALIKRALMSFEKVRARIPADIAPRELFVVGGADTPAIRATLARLTNLTAHYHPNVSARKASEILSQCAFGWIDYLDRESVPVSILLKSSSFAACAAHGIVPIFPRDGGRIGVGNDLVPGPFFTGADKQHLPARTERAAIASQIYAWYHRHASIAVVAKTVAGFLTAQEGIR